MISKYVYVKACKDAYIILSRTEKEVLDSVTINGWFDEDAIREHLVRKIRKPNTKGEGTI